MPNWGIVEMYSPDKESLLLKALDLVKSIDWEYNRILANAELIEALNREGMRNHIAGLLEDSYKSLEEISNPTSRTIAMIKLGKALYKIGNTNDAIDFLRKALFSVSSIPDDFEKSRVFEHLIDAIIGLKRHPEVIEELLTQLLDVANNNITDSYVRSEVLGEIILAFANTNMIKTAKKLLKKISSKSVKMRTEIELARVLVLKGKERDATKIVKKLNDRYKPEGFVALTNAFSQLGEFKKAHEYLEKLDKFRNADYYKALALVSILSHILTDKMKDFEKTFLEIISYVRNVEDNEKQAEVLLALADAILKKNIKEGSIVTKLINELKRVSKKLVGTDLEDVKTRIAELLVYTGKMKIGIELAEGIDYSNLHDEALAEISVLLGKKGLIDDALKIIDTLDNDYLKAVSIISLAKEK